MSSGSLMRLKPIKDYFKSKFISVSDQWIANQLNVNSNSSNEGIYQLWLNSDLMKMSQTNDNLMLPKDCNQLKFNEITQKSDKTTLNGKYALQINSIEDISRPKVLTTADTLGDDENSSENNSDNENENLFKRKKAKPKKVIAKRGSRMLSMVLTDGQTECKAIEYQPIDRLAINTPIGTKLLITGPVDIYGAVMFLTGRHVTVLGGSIGIIPSETNNDSNELPLRSVTLQTN